ncbi:MAG: dihydrolipoyl dehydrogenase [Gammaproteobacteria bacterium]|nr:dihydrolipoyl dehydrogenase [Gammaproteobacteria bacterium]
MSKVKLTVPDIGDFDEVEVIELMVSVGDTIKVDDSLITVESDKASMEIPASQTGKVTEILVAIGDKVSEGSDIIEIEASAEAVTTPETKEQKKSVDEPKKAQVAPAASQYSGQADVSAQVVVLGSGPGGYTAAFRAADLGKEVILIEKFDNIGGVCLNVGCIPSKALLHVAEVMHEAKEFSELGVSFNSPDIDIDRLRQHKEKVVGKLTGGLKQLAKQRKVKIVNGYGKFTSDHSIEVVDSEGNVQVVGFEQCIIAAGSSVTKLPFIPWQDKRVWDSTDALEINTVPKRLLVVGGGIIGLEMATVYQELGAEITVVELGPGLIPGADRDLLRGFERTLKKRYANIYLNTMVTAIEPTDDGLVCSFDGSASKKNKGKVPEQDTFDHVLVAIGRSPNGKKIDADKAGVIVNDHGFIEVDKQQKTNVDHIYAIGDIVGQPMLAHKATHEAKVAAEVICGHKRYFDARTIPSVAYTNPEIAWCGQTEEQLKDAGVEYEKGTFPWAASGRALSVGADGGMTKTLYDKNSHQMLGAGIVGKNAGELIAEAALAIEMGAEMDDIALTIHPHPTLSETLNFATEVAEGSCTDIYAPKK